MGVLLGRMVGWWVGCPHPQARPKLYGVIIKMDYFRNRLGWGGAPAPDDFDMTMDGAETPEELPAVRGGSIPVQVIDEYGAVGRQPSRPAPNPAMDTVSVPAEGTYWDDVGDVMVRVGTLSQGVPPGPEWDEVVRVNGQLARVIRQRDDAAVDPTLTELLQALETVPLAGGATDQAILDLRRAVCGAMTVSPAGLCAEMGGELDDLVARVLNVLESRRFDAWSPDRPVASWRAEYAATTGDVRKSRFVRALREYLWDMHERLALPTLEQTGVGAALAILCDAAPDSRCDTLVASLPVEVPRGAVDLNGMYAAKCTGRAPWQGSILCNLGKGGPMGRLVNSLRITPVAGGYAPDSLVQQMMGMLEGLTARLGPLGYLPGVQRFVALKDQLRARVDAGEAIRIDDFDPVMNMVVGMIELPGVRTLLRRFLAGYNASMLDL